MTKRKNSPPPQWKLNKEEEIEFWQSREKKCAVDLSARIKELEDNPGNKEIKEAYDEMSNENTELKEEKEEFP